MAYPEPFVHSKFSGVKMSIALQTRLLLQSTTLAYVIVLGVPLYSFAQTTPAAPPKSSVSANPLIDMLRSADAGTRAKAAREIGESGDRTAVPALAAVLRDPSEKVRREVVIALANIRTPASLDALITATRDTDSNTRTLAIRGLSGYYTGEVPDAGFTGFLKDTYGSAKKALSSDNTRIDPGVHVDPKVIAALRAALADTRSIQASRQAAKALGTLLVRPAVPDLVKSAHSIDVPLARESLYALAKIKDLSAGPQLLDLLDSPNQDIEQDAAETIGLLRTKEAVPRLQDLYQNGRGANLRHAAIEGLAYIGDPVSSSFLLQALWNGDKQERVSAAMGLGNAGDAKNVAEVEKALRSEKNGDVRLAMQYALAAMGQDQYVADLVESLRSNLHDDDGQTYLIDLTQNRRFLPTLYPYLKHKDAAVRRRLCTVLMYTGDSSSLGPLQALAHDENNDVAVQALRAARAIRTRTG